MGLLQNQNISQGGESAAAGERHLRKLAAEFNAVLDGCVDTAGIEEVHRVRTGSRRLQATIESDLRRAGAGAEGLKKPAQAWLRQMKKLRRAAGPVRDLDVHRKMLKRAVSNAGHNHDATAAGALGAPAADMEPGRGTGAAPDPDSLAEEMRAFEDWLSGKRHDEAAILVREIRKRRGKLTGRQADFFAALEKLRIRRLRGTLRASRLALEDFARATEAVPSLNTKNLHAFRKLTKKARYVAESDGGDPAAAAVARTLKRIQDAIGEWHDWLNLNGEAKIALKSDAPQLAAWLEERLDRSLVRALRVTRQARARLLGEWTSESEGRRRTPEAQRRPPSRAALGGLARNSAAGPDAA